MIRSADFTKEIKESLAAKVGYHCSNPFCRIPTVGANVDHSGSMSIGEAAHITAASPGGPRYDPSLTNEQRKMETNGIWLCRNHAAIIDRDEKFYTVELLYQWKMDAEREFNQRVQGLAPSEKYTYTLRMLLDDLKMCKESIDVLKAMKPAVVIPSSDLPVTEDYERKIETIADAIGIKYASRMRNAFRDISAFKIVLVNEENRFKNKAQWRMDFQAVEYDHKLQAFIERIKKYDIYEIIETLEQLFKDD